MAKKKTGQIRMHEFADELGVKCGKITKIVKRHGEGIAHCNAYVSKKDQVTIKKHLKMEYENRIKKKKAEEKKKKKTGRPIKGVTEEQCDMIEEMAAIGMSQEEMALVIGMKQSTFTKRLKDNRKLRGKYEKGKAVGKFDLVAKAYKLAKAGHITMLIFLLKTKYGFRERGFMMDGPDEVAVKVQEALSALEM